MQGWVAMGEHIRVPAHLGNPSGCNDVIDCPITGVDARVVPNHGYRFAVNHHVESRRLRLLCCHLEIAADDRGTAAVVCDGRRHPLQ